MPYWRRGLVVSMGVGVVAVLLAVSVPWLCVDSWYGHMLQRELDKLRAQGAPLTLTEAAPKPVPDDQNAAVLYMKVFQVSFEPSGLAGDGPEPKVGLIPIEEPENWLPGRWERLELMRPIIARPGSRFALQVLRAASVRPYSVFPVNWGAGVDVVFPHMPQMRHAAKLCATKAMLDAKDGGLPEALGWLGVCYRMANHASREPTTHGQLVAYRAIDIANRSAEAILDEADVTPAQAGALQRDLSRLNLAESQGKALAGERAWGLDIIAQLRTGQVTLFELSFEHAKETGSVGRLKRLEAKAKRPYWALEELNLLQAMGKAIERAEQPYRLTGPEATVVQKPPEQEVGSLVARWTWLVPSPSRSALDRDQALAGLSLLSTTLRLKAYRHEHGSYPPMLAGLGGTVPEDVFSGKPLGYRRQGQGFRLYSIGPNLKDDGGQPPYVRPMIEKEGDMVWECRR